MVNVFIQNKKENKDSLELPNEPLPPGWTVKKSRRTGCPFYYNQSLGLSQWVPPQHVIPSVAGAKPKSKGKIVSPSNNEILGISTAEDQRVPFLSMSKTAYEEPIMKGTAKGMGAGKGNNIPAGILAACPPLSKARVKVR